MFVPNRTLIPNFGLIGASPKTIRKMAVTDVEVGVIIAVIAGVALFLVLAGFVLKAVLAPGKLLGGPLIRPPPSGGLFLVSGVMMCHDPSAARRPPPASKRRLRGDATAASLPHGWADAPHGSARMRAEVGWRAAA